MMGKIIKIENDIIFIGTYCGKIEEVRRSDLTFLPQIGDHVEIFKTDSKTLVTLNKEFLNYNTKQPVNKVVYCVLTFLLGAFGIHKFYAGKIFQGVVYLIFCWTGITTIVALVEFVIALCQHENEYGDIYV